MNVKKNVAIISFKTQEDWEKWLAENHDKSDGIWIRIYKKASVIDTITYDQALDEALCYGWIDGLVNKYDELSYIQRFTPRRSKSMWSQRNREHIDRLTQLGKMKPSGMAQVAAAKADGRWDAAYASPAKAVPPEDFLQELVKNKKAEEFFKTLNKTNSYAIIWHIQTAKKPETRIRRIQKMIEMLNKGEKLY